MSSIKVTKYKASRLAITKVQKIIMYKNTNKSTTIIIENISKLFWFIITIYVLSKTGSNLGKL